MKEYWILAKVWKIACVTVTIPVWLTLFVHDGIVSCARSYTVNELMALGRAANIEAQRRRGQREDGGATYVWKAWRRDVNVMKMKAGFKTLIPMTFLIGLPHSFR